MMQSILVLCVGNICRSPVGEVLFADRFAQQSLNVSVQSAGLAALIDSPAHPIMQELMQVRGLNLSQHSARQLDQAFVYDAELILTMSKDQTKQVESQFPNARGRVYRLGEWGGYDIPDPFQRPRVIFDQSVALIEQGVDDWYKKFWK